MTDRDQQLARCQELLKKVDGLEERFMHCPFVGRAALLLTHGLATDEAFAEVAVRLSQAFEELISATTQARLVATTAHRQPWSRESALGVPLIKRDEK